MNKEEEVIRYSLSSAEENCLVWLCGHIALPVSKATTQIYRRWNTRYFQHNLGELAAWVATG